MDLLTRLQQIVGAGAVLTGPDMAGHLQPWMGGAAGQALCVVKPANRQEVVAVVQACAAIGQPIVPQGGNTGLTGAGVPLGAFDRPPVVINLGRLRHIRAVDAANNTITVEAGAVLAEVQAAAANVDRLFAVSLGSEGSCQIGGIISTNAGGTNVLRYGTTRAQVLGLEVVLPDGRLFEGLKGLRKDNTGYALRELFIGAEGSLGVITAATLRLHPRPKVTACAWVGLADPAAALALLAQVQAVAGESLTTYELMNEPQLRAVLHHRPDLRRPCESPWHLLVELADFTDGVALVTRLQMVLVEALTAGEIIDALPALSEAQRQMFWALRHATAEANRAEPQPRLSADIAVPLSALPQFFAQAQLAVRAIAPEARFLLLSHMGDGNVHFTTLLPPSSAKATVTEVAKVVNDCAMALGGSFSAEHGIGRKLVAELAMRTEPVALSLMEAVKQAIDPCGIMNPNCLLRARGLA